MNNFLKTLTLILILSGSAIAQPAIQGPISYAGSGSGSGGGGGSGGTPSSGNGILVNPSPCTSSCTISTTVDFDAQTGTSYAIPDTDGGLVVTGSNASAQGYTLVAASTSGYGSGFGFDLYNKGAGALTLTATTSTFGNALTTLALTTGQEAYVAADSASTNYLSFVSLPVIANNDALCNVSGAANYPVACTATQLTTLINAFSSSLSGAVPASGGGTTNFLRADGSWAAPSGGSGCTVTGTVNQIVSNNGSSACQSSATTATTAGNIVDPFAGIASTPALLFSASPFAGNGTTSFPALYFDNNATAPTTFSTAGTYFGINSASTSNNFFDMYVGTAQKAVLSGFGVLYLAGATSGSCSTAILCTAGPIIATTFINAGTNIQLGASGLFTFSGRGSLTSPAAGNIQFGISDAASPTAQTISMQSVAAGTSNVAGANTLINVSRGTGSGVGGNYTIDCAPHGAAATTQNTLVACLGVNGDTGLVTLPLITSDAGLTDASVCEDTTAHGLHAGSGTLGICLGTSSARFKHSIAAIPDSLDKIMLLKPVSYHLNPDHGDPTKQYDGFLAEDLVKIYPELVGFDKQHKPNTADLIGLIAQLTKGMQQEQIEITALQKKLAARR